MDVNIGIDKDGGEPKPITSAIANTPQKKLWIFPAGNSPFYAMSTVDDWVDTCSARAYMTPNEFIKIVQSLDWLP
ncbi:MAG: hypothetical protein ACKO7R_09010 [Pseudanabaena sp.]